jgi:[protein-PII] uridylyltransferase
VPGPRRTGAALVAVGGYGRRELAPFSDLDVVLVHADGADVEEAAGRVWYPLWDAGAHLDHSVRSLSEVGSAADRDLRVLLAMLDARHLAGDPCLTGQLRAGVLALWRRNAPRRLPELRATVVRRSMLNGELAHAAVPDLKQSAGGLRDAVVLKALVATWLVDVPHPDLERCRRQLLDVRDRLHAVAGRSTDRVAPELWVDLATALGLADGESAQRRVRDTGRRMTHLSRLTWRRVDDLLERRSTLRPRQPALRTLAPGLAASGGELVLDRGMRAERDPLLLLRAAAEAAERDLLLAPATAARLARECPDLPEPWGEPARTLLVRLLAAGPGLLGVWETLDETAALGRLLPEWERVRLLPHASVVHRFTVDRHLVETCIEASRLVRTVARPDVLMVAALLHDIGKGGSGDHSVAGAAVAAQVCRRVGFSAEAVSQVRRLVREHLLLVVTATTRDLSDPATVARVVERVGDTATLDLLLALTEADARATAPSAWTSWRSGLVADLARRVREALETRSGAEISRTSDRERVPTVDIPAEVRADPARVDVRLEATADGARVRVVSGDRVGLMAAVAGTLALMRLPVRSARAWTQHDVAVSVWDVEDDEADEGLVRQRLEAVLAGRVSAWDRLRPVVPGMLDASVAVRPGASQEATVLEVRVGNRPGVVYLVCEALASLQLSVRSAHVDTIGPQAVDVFYVQERGAGRLSEERAGSAVHAVRRVLEGAVTLDP